MDRLRALKAFPTEALNDDLAIEGYAGAATSVTVLELGTLRPAQVLSEWLPDKFVLIAFPSIGRSRDRVEIEFMEIDSEVRALDKNGAPA